MIFGLYNSAAQRYCEVIAASTQQYFTSAVLEGWVPARWPRLRHFPGTLA